MKTKLNRRNATIVASVAAAGVLTHGVYSCATDGEKDPTLLPTTSQDTGEGCPPADPPTIADTHAFNCGGEIFTVRDDGPKHVMLRLDSEWSSVPRDQTHVLDLGGVTVRFTAVEPPTLEILQP